MKRIKLIIVRLLFLIGAEVFSLIRVLEQFFDYTNKHTVISKCVFISNKNKNYISNKLLKSKSAESTEQDKVSLPLYSVIVNLIINLILSLIFGQKIKRY